MRKVRSYSGSLSAAVSDRETTHRKIVRTAASECFVLMKNDGLLPISKDSKVFLAGNGATRPIKGGTGSGDVNEREVVDIAAGFINAGIEIVNKAAIDESIEAFKANRQKAREYVLGKMSGAATGSGMDFFKIIEESKLNDISPVEIDKNLVKSSDLAIFVISRIAGEGIDRNAAEGDYFLSKEEKKQLKALAKCTENILVIINAGGQIDLNEIIANESVKAILNISQPGMEMGNAVADVLTGEVTPSGKLSSTWAVNYEDFPSSATFSHNNGDLENEKYEEGIYVGYRYFDSFGVKPAFPFGFGLSYTRFAFSEKKVAVKKNAIEVSARITNIGEQFSGKELMQIYLACPQSDLKKELKRLVGFKKTATLAPGKSETVTVSIASKMLASFDENLSSWIVEAGDYILLMGTSSENVSVCGIIHVDADTVIEKVKHICPLVDELEEIERQDEIVSAQLDAWKKEAEAAGIKAISFSPVEEKKAPAGRTDLDFLASELAAQLSDDELRAILMGEMSKGQDNLKDDELIETGIMVPGAAGETTCILEEKYDIPAISMADGPAGIRVLRSYEVDKKTGKIWSQGLLSALEGGLFASTKEHKNTDKYYMYATAIPVGSCLAQSFNPDLVASLGKLVGEEMTEFGISWWLAPGMNIQKNPLCGRNFEYYSEDPLVAGVMAAAMTNGVQSVPGVGTTIKHFACNNQEDNRMGVNSIVSERTLREIYLRGFEIAVKTSQPMCIMTSYNLINSIHSANNYDLCTVVAREEWGFAGVIMTDWITTANGSVSHVCSLAGNDLIMPGQQIDVDDISSAIRTGALPREAARACAARLIKVIFQTIGMEEPESYSKQFNF